MCDAIFDTIHGPIRCTETGDHVEHIGTCQVCTEDDGVLCELSWGPNEGRLLG